MMNSWKGHGFGVQCIVLAEDDVFSMLAEYIFHSGVFIQNKNEQCFVLSSYFYYETVPLVGTYYLQYLFD